MKNFIHITLVVLLLFGASFAGADPWGTGGGTPEGTAILSTGEAGGTKFLREDGDGTSSWQAVPGGAETNTLETTITGIADTEIFVGDGADSGTFVVVSGDATLANTGALSLAANSVDSDQYVDASIDPEHLSASVSVAGFSVVFDGGGSAIAANTQIWVKIPYACTITSVELLADQSGSIVIDIWKDTYANYPPTNADTITSSTPPTITTAIKSEDEILTSWTTSVTAGDILLFNVDSVTTIEKCTISIGVTR